MSWKNTFLPPDFGSGDDFKRCDWLALTSLHTLKLSANQTRPSAAQWREKNGPTLQPCIFSIRQPILMNFFFVGLEILWTFQNKKLEYNWTSQRWEVSVLVQTIRFFAEKWIHKNEAGSPETEWIQKILFLSERIHLSTRYKLRGIFEILEVSAKGVLNWFTYHVFSTTNLRIITGPPTSLKSPNLFYIFFR